MPDPSEANTPKRVANKSLWRWRLKARNKSLTGTIISIALATNATADLPNNEEDLLDNHIAAIQARGEPILFEDIQPPTVSPENNRAHLLRQALEAWPTLPPKYNQANTQKTDLMTWPTHGPDKTRITETDWYIKGGPSNPNHSVPDPISDNASYLLRCQTSRALLEKAKKKQHTDWGIRPAKHQILQTSLPHLGEQRELGRLCIDAAHRSLIVGDIPQAISWLQHTNEIALSQDDTTISLIHQLVSFSIQTSAIRGFEELLLPAIHPKDIDTASDQAIRQFIDHLLDEKRWHNAMLAAIIGERRMLFDAYEGLVVNEHPLNSLGKDSKNFPRDLEEAKPLLMHGVILLLQSFDAFHTALKQETYPGLLDEMRRHGFDDGTLEKRFTEGKPEETLASIMMPSFTASGRSMFRTSANRRMAAIALAIKLYTRDHGSVPTNLDALVPNYLPVVPKDPFSANNKTIGYLPNGGTLGWSRDLPQEETSLSVLTKIEPSHPLPPSPPLLYSVGLDGIDNGGLVIISDRGKPIRTASWKSDAWFALDVFQHLTTHPEYKPVNPQDPFQQ